MNSSDERYGLASARVMAHDYGDEVVAANLDTGWFYSFTGTHRVAWCALADGYSRTEVATAAITPQAAAAVDEVIELATTASLITPLDRPVPEQPLAPLDWIEGDSGIESFDDLQDALLLDPVHETTEAGWPYAAPPSIGGTAAAP